ncbi:unnamed protein product, partial [Effrenium voratum]
DKALQGLMDKAQASLAQLQQATAAEMWTQSIKPKEVQGRLDKGLQLASKLESYPKEAQAAALLAKLIAESER